jgi:excisionase family DNA binding protein
VDDLSVAEAARALAVDESRVRQLLRSGALGGRHVGRAWLVSGEALADLRSQRSPAGRPLAPKRAWALLDLLDGGRAAWLEPVARSQVRAHLRRLRGAEAAQWRAALRAREARHPVNGHRAALSRLAVTDGVWPAGPAMASAIGADLVAPGARSELYVPHENWPALARQLHLSPAVEGAAVLVRVPRGLWPFGPNGPGRAALAASLIDSGEWRTARAGADVLNDLATRVGP